MTVGRGDSIAARFFLEQRHEIAPLCLRRTAPRDKRLKYSLK
jgi:hypothetical protein